MMKLVTLMTFAALAMGCLPRSQPEEVEQKLDPVISDDTAEVVVDWSWVKDSFRLNIVQNGDIVLKRGYGAISRLITNALDEPIPLSHCAVIVESENGFIIIQSVSQEASDADGVQSITLDKFLEDIYQDQIYVIRHRSDEDERYHIADVAIGYLHRIIPFDHEFDYLEKDRMYCSELIYNILLDVYGKNFFETKEFKTNSILTFNSLLQNPEFQKIDVLPKSTTN